MKILNNVRIYRPFVNDGISDLYHITMEDGKIVSINRGLAEEMGEHVVNGQERVITAAFNDFHMHLLRYGIMKKELDFRDVTSYGERRKSFI